jgi:hypothetical protein
MAVMVPFTGGSVALAGIVGWFTTKARRTRRTPWAGNDISFRVERVPVQFFVLGQAEILDQEHPKNPLELP